MLDRLSTRIRVGAITDHPFSWPNDTWVTICTLDVERADVDGGIEGLRLSDIGSDDWDSGFGGSFYFGVWSVGGTPRLQASTNCCSMQMIHHCH